MKLLDARHLNLITGIEPIKTRYQTCSLANPGFWKGKKK